MNATRKARPHHAVDLGPLPPIVTRDAAGGLPGGRNLSVRWLSGTVLAALASTSLMGGTLYAAIEGRPGRVAVIGAEAVTRGVAIAPATGDLVAKGDLLVPEEGPPPARQILQASTVTRDGEREYIRSRPFMRIASPLLAVPEASAGAIPEFDPLRVFADANQPAPVPTGPADTLYGAAIDGEMTMRISDFPLYLTDVATPFVDPHRVEMAVRESAPFLGGTPVDVAALSMVSPTRFDFGFGERNPFDELGVSVVPENVSFVAMSNDERLTSDGNTEERLLTLGPGTTLFDVLVGAEATEEEADQIVTALVFDFSIVRVPVGSRVWLVMAPSGDESGRFHPVRVSIYSRDAHLATVALSDQGGYIAVPEPLGGPNVTETANTAPASGAADDDGPLPRLYESLYYTARENEMTPEMIDELVRVYSYNVDFNARIAPQDNIELLFSMDAEDTADEEPTEILYASIALGGEVHSFYRYRSAVDGLVDYYDADGRSAKQFLMRKPLTGGVFRSGFGGRNHPILRTVRAHTGVDWAAPRGTPILATGDGTIEQSEWFSGYGNYVRIRHANGYETAYGHMDRYGAGIAPGVRVRQGQIIGYVGSTGLSTGPHVHYEVLVNGTQVDPMRVRIPEGRTLDGDDLVAFTAERERIDALLGKDPPPRLAAAATVEGG
jgi:murein DD-endopeptidase MepM/ murein hydrolase activator NlpD